jgi:hypothetical protein
MDKIEEILKTAKTVWTLPPSEDTEVCTVTVVFCLQGEVREIFGQSFVRGEVLRRVPPKAVQMLRREAEWEARQVVQDLLLCLMDETACTGEALRVYDEDRDGPTHSTEHL